jgi:hypothetical protein
LIAFGNEMAQNAFGQSGICKKAGKKRAGWQKQLCIGSLLHRPLQLRKTLQGNFPTIPL